MILDKFERHIGELPAAFLKADGTARTKKAVPVAAALGLIQVPGSTAAKAQAALAKAKKAMPDGTEPAVLLDQILTNYLSTVGA